MNYDARELARVRNPILLISAATWMLILLEPRGARLLVHCPAASWAGRPFSTSFPMLLAGSSPASLAAGWALMLVAMMSPVLIPPVRHIRLRSFTHRRVRSTALFVAGYAAIWMTLGGLLLAIAMAFKLSIQQSYLPVAASAVAVLAWQCSPFKQRCLNRCQAHTELAAFGAAADCDALRFGITHGIWCAGSCWGLMLFPLLLPGRHVVAMVAAAVLIFSERLEHPEPPCWRFRGPGKAMRLVAAQTRLRLAAR